MMMTMMMMRMIMMTMVIIGMMMNTKKMGLSTISNAVFHSLLMVNLMMMGHWRFASVAMQKLV